MDTDFKKVDINSARDLLRSVSYVSMIASYIDEVEYEEDRVEACSASVACFKSMADMTSRIIANSVITGRKIFLKTTYHLKHGCSDVNVQQCSWIRRQIAMKEFRMITTPLEKTEPCEKVAVRQKSLFFKISGKLWKSAVEQTSRSAFDYFVQSIEDNRQDAAESVPCTCIISPEEGYSLITEFNITCIANTTGLHDTVLYNVYQTSETGKHNMIYLGHSPDMTYIYLHAGHKKENYTYDISISLDRSHGLQTVGKCTDLAVKVFPMSMYSSGDVTDVITDLIGSDVNSNDSVINNLMDNGDFTGAVNILGGVASSLNDNVNKSSGEESKQIREVIVSSLTKVSVTSLDDLDLVAGVLNSATSISDELTDYTQVYLYRLFQPLPVQI
ncbi:unnamed protein product [Mytilus coruscus]|uniref:PKD/REJ-like domain-containing protein n=1 Tax=Mytilus coruscus TaxID=42192 RepID=A0A6J8DZP8_MYTCO|nr:unnamed protein product [Mytilus coruscus]